MLHTEYATGPWALRALPTLSPSQNWKALVEPKSRIKSLNICKSDNYMICWGVVKQGGSLTISKELGTVSRRVNSQLNRTITQVINGIWLGPNRWVWKVTLG